MSRGAMYAKMAGVFLACSIGGPAIMYYITPAEGELFKRFNPDLQKRNLENRERRKQEYEDFSRQMIEYSKSSKPIWEAAEDARILKRDEILRQQAEERAQAERAKADMKAQMAR